MGGSTPPEHGIIGAVRGYKKQPGVRVPAVTGNECYFHPI